MESQSPSATGYSIWLMPAGTVYDALREQISDLSREFGTPTFEPHVTLMGGLEGKEHDVAASTARLAGIVRPYRIILRGAAQTDYYFRCVFSTADKEDEVMDANRAAKEVFGRHDDAPYMPHLSLVYGNLPEETRNALVAKFDDLVAEFPVDRLHLFRTEGIVPQWRKVDEFALSDV